jgi:hypothetical protein
LILLLHAVTLLCLSLLLLLRVYFTAQASHLAHLARKLEAAADEAMALSPQQRRDMAGQALARRFPAGEMMAAYAGAWQQVRQCITA